MSALHTILHFTWALPQTLLGLVLRGWGYFEIVTIWDSVPNTFVGVEWLKNSMFSLGRHVFYPSSSSLTLTDNTIRHELGHSRQSLILGPLYLPVIAIPSVCWFYLHKWCKLKCSYYWFYTERWANRLAGIDLK